MPDLTPEPLALAELKALLVNVEGGDPECSPSWHRRYLARVCRQAIAQSKELERLRAILDAPQTALFADGREPTTNERHPLNLLSWRRKEADDALAEIERLRPFEAAITSMAAQYLCPKTTPEQLCAEINRGKETTP